MTKQAFRRVRRGERSSGMRGAERALRVDRGQHHIRTHRAKHGIHLQQLQEEPADAESDCTAKEGAATQLPTA